MDFQKDYLKDWQRSAQETLNDSRVKTYLENFIREGAKLPTERFIKELNRKMQEYATAWSKVADKHTDSGLYKKVQEFMGPTKGLHLDIACGSGNFLAELKTQSCLGMDISGYSLQIAQQKLERVGLEATLRDDSYISFDPTKGFVLRAHPILEELDLSTPTLISDDVKTFHNTMRVLYNNGVKADSASFMLGGGISTYRAGQFIEILAAMQGIKQEESPFKLIDDVITNLPKVLHHNGRLFLGIRSTKGIEGKPEDRTINIPNIEQEIKERYSKLIKVVRTQSTEMKQENNSDGISIHVVSDSNIKPTEKEMEWASKQPYELLMVEALVRGT